MRFRRGFGEVEDSNGKSKAKRQEPALRTPAEELRAALRAPYPKNSLPVAVALNFIDLPQRGATLTTSLKVNTGSMTMETPAAGQPSQANLDFAIAVFDDQGKLFSSFEKRLVIRSSSTNAGSAPPESVFYNHYTAIKPGLYQVRVAAFDEKQRKAGSAHQWIEVPDLGTKTLAMSSLIVGEKKKEADVQIDADPAKTAADEASPFARVRLNVDRHFANSSRLRFLTFIYNAARGGAGDAAGNATAPILPTSSLASPAPDLAVQVQLLRDNEPVITSPLRKIQTEVQIDLARVSYAAEVSIEDLQPGRYVLLVTVIDRIAKASAAQRFGFHID